MVGCRRDAPANRAPGIGVFSKILFSAFPKEKIFMNITSRQFLSIGMLSLLAGIAFGLSMAISGNFDQIPTHAHVMLVGWASATLFGLVYHQFPETAVRRPARLHAALHLVGLVVMIYGVHRFHAGDPTGGEPFAAGGAMIFGAGSLVFVVTMLATLWRRGAA